MTQDEIIRMAYEAGGVKGEHTVLNHTWFELTAEQLERFAALVAAHEREACAVLCDGLIDNLEDGTNVDCYKETAERCAAAIRARGEK